MVMEKFRSFNFPCSFPLPLFLLCFLSLHVSSSAFTPPAEYFVSCGSDAHIYYARRTFAGDSNSSNSLSFTFKGRSTSVLNTNKSTQTLTLYQTARVFKEKSSYEFEISSSGIYVVRFHFFAFDSPDYNLSSAFFDVSASGVSLLNDFTLNNRSSNFLVEEFFSNVNIGKFIIQFLPHESSFAFVNAIEVFIAPDDLIPDEAPHISPAGSERKNYESIRSKVLETIHRINVGGLTLTPENDTLWRYWTPDDEYLYMPDTAKNADYHGDKPKYLPGVTEFIAPDFVYQTAKEMNITDSLSSNNFNITWIFNVSKNAGHFIRAHFCDIISPSLTNFVFNIHIYSHYSLKIDPYDKVGQLAAPFYFDFVVDSDDSGLMNIGIGPRSDSDTRNAFLNGLEIMEIVGEFGSVLVEEQKKVSVIVIVGAVLGGLAVISILAVGVCFCLRCRKQKPVEVLDYSPRPVNGRGSFHNRMADILTISSRLPQLNFGLKISFAEIMFATNNFDAKLIVGKGGFGLVYRGTLRNGTTVAVKRSEPESGQGLPEFHTEIMVLSNIRHRHLVSLIGYCDEMSEMILVYEFMGNGTLRDHLYKSALPCLSWRQRLEICIGAAKGLHYLHRGAAGRYIHRDVKSTNILLDECFVAKVADFGLSTLGPPDQTHVSTTVKGTFGYLDPEYFKTQQLTEKSDVYSFGVVLLEVLCARPAINVSLPMEEVNLVEWGLLCKQRGTLEQIIDPLIKNQINPNSLRKFADIAEKCLQECGPDRPSMGDVQWDLEYALQLQQTTTQREPHEDSATDASAMLAVPNVQSFASLGMSVEKDDMPILSEHSSSLWATDVFSQLRIGDAR